MADLSAVIRLIVMLSASATHYDRTNSVLGLGLEQLASPNSAYNREHADLCIPKRPRGRAKTPFPVITAIPV